MGIRSYFGPRVTDAGEPYWPLHRMIGAGFILLIAIGLLLLATTGTQEYRGVFDFLLWMLRMAPVILVCVILFLLGAMIVSRREGDHKTAAARVKQVVGVLIALVVVIVAIVLTAGIHNY